MFANWEQISIVEVWRALGGPEPKKSGARDMRSTAFWRGGHGLNVALDAARNVWFDFRDARGGGILDLVQLVLGCSYLDAVRWLRDNFGLSDRQETALERRQRLRRQRELDKFEALLQESYRALLGELYEDRDTLICLLRLGPDPRRELELEVTYWRIDSIRRAIDRGEISDEDVAFTIALVDLIAGKCE